MTLEEKIEKQLTEIQAKWGDVAGLPGAIATLNTDLQTMREGFAGLQRNIDDIRRHRLIGDGNTRAPGQMSVRGAALVGAAVVLALDKRNLLGSDNILGSRAPAKVKEATDIVQRWTGQTASEFPQPSTYSGEIDALIPDYGVVRRVMTPWPLSGGTDKPPRHKTAMTFGYTAINIALTEKNPAFEFASLESHKCGGVVITPRELFEQSVVDIGMYLGLLAAKEFARVEDDSGFNGDGGANYDNSVKGVCKIALDNSKTVQFSGGKTSPNDLTATYCRSALGKLNAAALSRAAWYFHSSFQAFLPDLNTEANQYTYRETANGQAMLFGRPIIWTDVLQSHTTSAAAAAYIAVVGDLSWFWFGKRPGGPRIDVSDQVLFTSDQIATRFINEIDFDYRATDAAAAILTAAN